MYSNVDYVFLFVSLFTATEVNLSHAIFRHGGGGGAGSQRLRQRG